jgi:hypothetical protein
MSKPNQPSKPRQLIRKLITIHSAPGRSRQAVISVIPIAVSLVTMGLIVSPTHAAMGMIGAMGALAGNNNAPLSRARILFGVGNLFSMPRPDVGADRMASAHHPR